MKKIMSALSAVLVGFSLSAADMRYEFDAANPGNIKLPAGIKRVGGVFRMENGIEGIKLPGSEKFRFAESGLTIMAVVNMDRSGVNSVGRYADGSFVDNYHVIASKGKEFVFGRRGDNWVDQLYFNFGVKGKWQVPLNKTVNVPAYGQNVHVAVTLQRDFRPGDDRNHYVYHFYINGILKFSGDCRSDEITPTDAPVIIGRGEGLLGRQWCFPGAFDEVKVINRNLTGEEVLAAAIKSKHVKIVVPDRVVLDEAALRKFEKIEAVSAAPAKWASKALRRAARNCYDLAAVKRTLDKLAKFAGEKDFDRFADAWNRNAAPFKIISAGDRLSLMMVCGSGKGAFPVLDMYDRRSGRGLFGADTLKWQLKGVRSAGKKGYPVEFSCFGSSWTTGKIRNAGNMKELDIRWQHGKVTVDSVMRFGENRCEFTLNADNKDANLRIDELLFPVFSLRQLKASGEALILPRMNGERIARPLDNPNQIPPESGQPSAMLSMQFCGYRDDRTALYIGMEDPNAGARHFIVQPLIDQLQFTYRQPVGCKVGSRGGNPVKFSGKAAFQVQDGDWYELGRTYRKFLVKDAPWWIEQLPRKSTPKWMRENVLWLLLSSESKDGNLRAFKEDIEELKKYIGLPIAVHVYGWNDYEGKGDMPNFYARSASQQALTELKNKGFRTLPYFDTLLWSLTDGPGFKAAEFPTKGRAAAYIKKNGSLHLQTWGRPRRQYAVMCPSVPLWQKRMEYMCGYIMDNYAFDGIYHDQVAGNYARACYATNHPHQPGDPLAWNRGWKELFDLQDKIRIRHPEMITTTEDANETHLRFFDGFLVWRWVYRNQIPLFNSLYSGRVQFVGRIYDQARKGDLEDYFVKAASQFVYAEQLGWMIPRSLAKDPERRRFVKQMCHLRYTLLEYFNCGEFSAPLKFRTPPAQREMFWGNPGTPNKVVTDNILHSVYTLGGRKLMIFVNTTPGVEAVSPLASLAKGEVFALCDPQLPSVKYLNTMPEIKLPPRGFALVLAGKRQEIEAEALRLHGALKKIAAFDYGQNVFSKLPTRSLKLGEKESFSGMFGRNIAPYSSDGSFVLTGSGKSRVSETLFIEGLKLNKRYRISMFVRADKGVSAALVLGYTTPDWKSGYRKVIGGKVPSDGKWHQISAEFVADKTVFRSWLMIYNDSKGNYSVDDILVEEITK